MLIGAMGTQVISVQRRACPIKFKEAYSEIREQLPYFLGLSAENGFSLLEQAGFSEISRHDHLFHENPYEYNNEFFVLSAVNDCRKK